MKIGMAKSSVLLNLSCGKEKLVGYVNVDENPENHPDVVASLEKRLPFKDNSVDSILLKHGIEHLNEPTRFVKECHRILKPRGLLEVHALHASNVQSAGELQHKRPGLSVFSFHYTTRHAKQMKSVYPLLFELEGVRIQTNPLWQWLADLSPIKYESYFAKFFGAREISFKLRKENP